MDANALSIWSPEQVEIITKTISPGLTDQELALFAVICQRTQLDPFAKQIYAIKRGGRLTTMASIDGLRLIAERTGQYAPGEETEFLYDGEGKLMGAKVYVKKRTSDGSWHRIGATALISEYSTNQGLWAKMPSVMIEKVAESRALRKAFPQDTAGLYEPTEMDQADKPVIKSARSLVTQDQANELYELVDGIPGLEAELIKMAKISCFEELAADRFINCKEYILKRIRELAVDDAEDLSDGTR